MYKQYLGNAKVYESLTNEINIKIPPLLYRKIKNIKLPYCKYIIGGSHTIAGKTPHFHIRRNLFENQIWPYNTNLNDSRFFVRNYTFGYPAINFDIIMSTYEKDYNIVYLLDNKNNKIFDDDVINLKPIAKFTFTNDYIYLDEVFE